MQKTFRLPLLLVATSQLVDCDANRSKTTRVNLMIYQWANLLRATCSRPNVSQLGVFVVFEWMPRSLNKIWFQLFRSNSDMEVADPLDASDDSYFPFRVDVVHIVFVSAGMTACPNWRCMQSIWIQGNTCAARNSNAIWFSQWKLEKNQIWHVESRAAGFILVSHFMRLNDCHSVRVSSILNSPYRMGH